VQLWTRVRWNECWIQSQWECFERTISFYFGAILECFEKTICFYFGATSLCVDMLRDWRNAPKPRSELMEKSLSAVCLKQLQALTLSVQLDVCAWAPASVWRPMSVSGDYTSSENHLLDFELQDGGCLLETSTRVAMSGIRDRRHLSNLELFLSFKLSD